MLIIFTLLISFFTRPALAHVKWFSDYGFDQPPLELSALYGPTFWGLFALSIVSLPLLVFLDRLAEKSHVYHSLNTFLDQYSANGPLIMRVTMGAVLLMSWQADSIIAPEIPIPSPVWGWLQFLLALCLLFKTTTFLTGIGVVFFWLMGISNHGIFHMLDYVVYPAVGLYLILSYVKNERVRHLNLPILYSGLGFSLCWVAFEKLLYPFWGLSVLAQAPSLTMGLNHEFFLLSAAFIEFTLGYLLIICLLHRPLAAVITLVFFITTSFFGKTEVVGHTILHGALLVFIVRGPGDYYQAPIRFHKSAWLRSLFAMVNFVVLFFILAIPYQSLAKSVYVKAMSKRSQQIHPRIEIPVGEQVPTIELKVAADERGGWNLQIITTNFTFTPQKVGGKDGAYEGHAHLFIDGKKVGRIYSNWFHLEIPPGTHKVKVNLTSNSHMDYYYQDKPIEAEIDVTEERNVKSGHHH
jgi:uncharacterized membrane protein YphA (DoxX/SURF4 family)